MARYSRRTGVHLQYTSDALHAVRTKFADFLSLLELHDRSMALISEMEEKSQGDSLFDLAYVRTSLAEMRGDVKRMIEIMVKLGGEKYAGLRNRFTEIGARIDESLPWCGSVGQERFTIAFDELSRCFACTVGSKSAHLGEMRSALQLPTPDGFAITAYGCQHFREANNLNDRIGAKIDEVDFQRYRDLVRVSEEIQQMIAAAPVPPALAEAIQDSFAELQRRHPTSSFAMRSSALGEDTWFSFAGQYASFLNIRPEDLLDSYRAILASKFTPKAIYYLLSHSLHETDLAMGVGCMEMVDAVASGVIYTRDPVAPESTSILVHSIYGLGKYLVDGRVSPDFFAIDRDTFEVTDRRLSSKRLKLLMAEGGGTVEAEVPIDDRYKPSINGRQLEELARLALRIEKHYDHPQDIEWALRRDGALFLLQTRPLKLVSTAPSDQPIDMSAAEVLRDHGTTVCPGAAIGALYHIDSEDDLAEVPDGAVLVVRQPFPGLITVMGKAAAIVTEVGGRATHMATIAREYRVPTVGGISRAGDLQAGRVVTVDATVGTIYSEAHPRLVEAREPDYDLFADMDIFRLLEDVIVHVAPLNLLQPTDDDFCIDRCRTLHDIIRYVHQKSIEEMFYGAIAVGGTEEIRYRLETEIPLTVEMIYLDRELPHGSGEHLVNERRIGSRPMEKFWGGLTAEGWPIPLRAKTYDAIPSVLGSRGRKHGYSQNSFAVLSREYMILSLRMGYHFATVESFCTNDPSKNYIRYQHKQGGASLARRIRRVKVLNEILRRIGFRRSSQGDFLQAEIVHLPVERIDEILTKLGRLTMLTKQLDMALSTDDIAIWYIEEFSKRLDIKAPRSHPD